MIEFVLGNVILFLLKSTGDTIDKYDIPYFVLSVAIIYSLSAQFYNVFIGNMI